MANTIRAVLVVTAIVIATFLPFFPGGYDSLSKPLLAWILGRAGLLLVPVGGLWLLTPQRPGAGFGPRGCLVLLTLGACILVALMLVFIAFASGPLLAALTLDAKEVKIPGSHGRRVYDAAVREALGVLSASQEDL